MIARTGRGGGVELTVAHVVVVAAAAGIVAGCPVQVHAQGCCVPSTWHGQAHGGGERVGDMAEGSGGVWVVGGKVVMVKRKVHGRLWWCRW